MPHPELTYLKQFLLQDRLQRLEEALKERTRHLAVILENVHHDHNASACLRTMDCLGLQDVHVIDSDNQFRPNRDVALGASKWLTIHRYQSETPADSEQSIVTQQTNCFRSLREQGYRILATSPRQNSVPLQDIDVEQPLAIVFGAEQMGVTEESIEAADELIHIPMYGFTESFNISVSVAVVLHHLMLKLRTSQIPWQLPQDQQQAVLLQWVQKSLGQKYEPLKQRFDDDLRSSL